MRSRSGGNRTIEKKFRINAEIRSRQVRLIAEDGAQFGVVSTADALKIAEERGFDMVEVSPDAEPPVCRLLDYGKFKYQQKKKTQQARKKQHVVHIKEVRLRPITEEHDVETKIKHARQFLENGDKVMIDMIFRGRQIAHKEIGREIVDRVVKALEDLGKIEQRVMMQGSHMTCTIAPKDLPATPGSHPAKPAHKSPAAAKPAAPSAPGAPAVPASAATPAAPATPATTPAPAAPAAPIPPGAPAAPPPAPGKTS